MGLKEWLLLLQRLLAKGRGDIIKMDRLNLRDLKNFQIVKQDILQVHDGICAFYDRAFIRDLDTGKEAFIDSKLINLIFPLFDKYAETQMKRSGVWDAANSKEKKDER
jgi:hypothetical protein